MQRMKSRWGEKERFGDETKGTSGLKISKKNEKPAGGSDA